LKDALSTSLRGLVGPEGVADAGERRFHVDATESQGVSGRPAAVVLPSSSDEVAAVVAWAYAHDVALVPRGGGSGFAGGAVAGPDEVVVALERMRAVRRFDPHLWRIEVEAGLETATVRRLARESGLLFPPDPGAAEQSQIGGNIATDAGGPHAFKYGTTGAWVTGLEAVVPPGEIVVAGGGLRKDVAGYDLVSLLTGSEGTLGIICSAWLRLTPAPAASRVVAAAYRGPAEGCAAIEAVLAAGVVPAALEFLDAGALRAARASYPFELAADAGFLVLAEADGGNAEVEWTAHELVEILEVGASDLAEPTTRADVAALWRWREGVSGAVTAVRGGKVSDDVAVPVDRLAEAIEATVQIGARHGLEACSWGHAGDGNLHATFLVDRTSSDEIRRAKDASAELYEVAVALGGTISGEHGIGMLKRPYLDLRLSVETIAAQRAIKQALDPKGLMNPGKLL
jgi:glycolate oxidase subunit GlcD